MTQKHIHQYVRVKIANRKDAITWFKCNAIGCTHRERKEFLENRLSICNRCGEQIILSKGKLELAKPHCDKCTKSPKQEEINKLASLFKD